MKNSFWDFSERKSNEKYLQLIAHIFDCNFFRLLPSISLPPPPEINCCGAIKNKRFEVSSPLPDDNVAVVENKEELAEENKWISRIVE